MIIVTPIKKKYFEIGIFFFCSMHCQNNQQYSWNFSFIYYEAQYEYLLGNFLDTYVQKKGLNYRFGLIGLTQKFSI